MIFEPHEIAKADELVKKCHGQGKCPLEDQYGIIHCCFGNVENCEEITQFHWLQKIAIDEMGLQVEVIW